MKTFQQHLNESNLVNHTRRELELAGMYDDSHETGTYNKLVANAVLELVQKFAEQGHSGFSASIVREIFSKVSSFQTLTPITSNIDEWEDVSHYGDTEPGTMWQNKRNPAVFSYDKGKTWKSVDESVMKKLEDSLIEIANNLYPSKFMMFEEFKNPFPHQIKSEKYWTQVLKDSEFAMKLLKTVMTKQNGFASDRQMAIFRRVEKGDKSPYPAKN